MFDISEDGDLIYNVDPDVTPVPSEDGSLFFAPSQSPAPQGEISQNGADNTVLGDASFELPPSPSPEPVFDPVTGELVMPSSSPDPLMQLPEFSGDLSLTTSGDIYIYPDMPEEELSLDEWDASRSVTSANVTGLPSSTSLQYLEDVARGYPSHYKYMAFKSDSSYSQSMVLYIGASGEKNASQNRMEFTDVDRIEVNYIRSSSTNYYQYVKSHYDSYSVPYGTNVFLYTNIVDGYAEFDIDSPFPVAGFLFLAAAAVILSLIFRGGGRN